MGNKILDRRERAMEYFCEGYNCAQAVLLAFGDEVNIPIDEIVKLTMPFGGGISRLRSVCGAVSGMIMAYGLICGESAIPPVEVRGEHYKNVQELVKEFSDINGSFICAELIKGLNPTQNPIPDIRNDEYYCKRPCKELVGDATQILEKYLKHREESN